MTPSRAGPVAVGRLLRLSLLPSAVADVSVGMVLGGAGYWPGGARPWLLVAASLGIYHGAMALNDWADRAEDARTRPERPIPSGAIAPGAALALGVGLVAGGVGCAALTSARVGVWMAVVAAAAVLYDLVGRGAFRGPALLGACRFGNFAGGVFAAQTWSARPGIEAGWLVPPLLYGAYVFSLSRLARLEDLEDTRPLGLRPRRHALAALTCLGLVPVCALALPTGFGALGFGAAALVAGAALAQPMRAVLARDEWSRADVGRTTGALLRRLLVFTAASALLLADAGATPWVVAALVLAGYPLAHALRKVFPPT